MRKLAWLCGLFLSSAIPAMAQDETPRFEGSAGYTYIRANVKGTVGTTNVSQGFNVNGGSGSVAFNLNRWLGAVADLGGSSTTQSFTPPGGTKTTASGTLFTYLFGPRISHRGSRWTPFGQALFGGARVSSSGASRNEFAFTVGGGLDANVSKHFAIRLIQAEYFFTDFTAKGAGTPPAFTISHQNNARLTFGIVIH